MAYSSVRFSRRFGRMVILAGFVAGNVVTPALAGPSGGRIIAGQGAISQSGANSTINQGTDRLIIEWQNFDTSAGESVRFNQPSSSASVLNRIISGNATIFDGSLFANGNVVIVNGSGIHFGPNSRIDVGSLIASTADISNSNFLNNRLIFDRPGQPDASITNAGTITVRDTGLAALVAPGVENSGLIQANLGTVILAAGEAHTIDFNGDGLMSFTVTKPTTAKPKRRNGKTLDALVSNKGEIRADGGTVLLTARQASRVLDNSINMSGVVRANSVGVRNGKIVLFGGKRGRVNVSGKIRARGKRRGQRGGRVHITGRKVAVPIAKIDVTGKAGGGEVLIGGAYKGGKLAGDSSIGYLQSGDLVSILTGTNAGAAGNGYFPTAEEVFFGREAVIDASALDNGDGGRAILWADDKTTFSGTISARGGINSGAGGLIEVSAHNVHVDGTINLDAPAGPGGTFLIDPINACLANVAASCAGVGSFVDIGSLVVPALNSAGSIVTVVITTIGVGADEGDITIIDPINTATTVTGSATLSLLADDDILVNAAISDAGNGLNLNLQTDIGGTGGGEIIVGAPIASNGGNVTMVADDIALNSTVNAGAGTVTLAPVSAGRLVDLGTETAGSLSLTDVELDRVTAGTLRVGGTNSGDVTVTSTISPANTGTLSVLSGAGIVDGNAAGTGLDFQVANLALQAASGIGVGANATIETAAQTVAASNSTSGSIKITQLTGFGDLTVSTVDGVIGVDNQATTALSQTTLSSSGGNLIVNSKVATVGDHLFLQATGGFLIDNNAAISTVSAFVDLQAEDMALEGGTISTGAGVSVRLVPFFVGTKVDLGSITDAAAATLELSNAELNTITTDSLQVGRSGIGDITITDQVQPANVSTLSLRTSGAVLDANVGTDITIANLGVRTGNGFGTAGSGIGLNVANLAFSNTGGVVNLSNLGDLTIAALDGLATSTNTGATTAIATLAPGGVLTFTVDTSSTGNTDYTAGTITVDDGPANSGVIVSSGGTLNLNAATVNLDGNLTATGGITGAATTVNVLGSAPSAGRRAELQDAVDVAVAGARVNVAAGTYSRFTIDKANLTVNGAGATTIVNAASPAITVTANGTTVQNMLLQGTGAVDDVGILLDGTTTPGLTGITITNVDFDNLDDGIRSQGDIGDGVAANVDVTIAGNSNIDRAIFSDFLDAAIDVGDTTSNDAVYVVRDIVIQDGNDNDAVAAVDGIRFGSIGAATVQGTMISAVSDDGIDFSNTLTNATILVGGLPTMPTTGNTISASGTGIEVAMIDGGNFDVANNSIVGGFEGIDFRRILNNASVEIAANSLIQGGFDGVVFRDIDTSTVAIAGNTRITGTSFAGIAFFGTINDSSVTVGPASITVGTTATAFGANTITGGDIGIAHIEGGVIAGTSIVTYAGNDISGGSNGIFFDRIIDSAQVNITDNSNITGASNTGILFSEQIEGGAGVTISGNPITGGENGILFRDFIDTISATGIQINDNSRITGTNRDGIAFEGFVNETIVDLNGNADISGAVNGVFFTSVSGTDVTVNGSTITGGMTGFDISGAPNPGNRNHLSIANSVIRGMTGAGLRVTTLSGGNGFTTNLSGGVTLTGAPALALSGLDQTLAGDTLNDTRFNGVNGANFVELSDGALFEPGRPTLIDGRDAFFDGVPVPDMSPPALIQAVEDRLIDFDDDTTLGQIFFTPFVPGPVEVETETSIPVSISTGPNLDVLIGQFNFLLETSIRLINPQTPGDWILRPDYPFDILFGDLLANLYPLGGCLPVFDDTGAVASFSCIAPAQGSDVSEFIDAYMADLP